MPGHDHIRCESLHRGLNLICRHMVAFRVNQPALMSCIDERTCDAKKTKGNLVANATGCEGDVGWIDEEYTHEVFLSSAPRSRWDGACCDGFCNQIFFFLPCVYVLMVIKRQIKNRIGEANAVSLNEDQMVRVRE